MAVSEAAMRESLRALPNLPGFTFPNYKERNHKNQTWGMVNGQRIEHKEGLSHERPKFVKAPKPVDPWRSGSLPDSQTRTVFKNAGRDVEHSELPAWDAFDRHVLRFEGYFKEPVVETNLENFRVRQVIFYYYLEDDTCQVLEPKQDNSGLAQGTLIRRHRFPHASGGYMQPENLEVGGDIHIYGRTIRLTDCDAFTREYYNQVGQDQPDAVEIERDSWMHTQEANKKPSSTQPRTYEKIYREVMLGGGHINSDMQQFLENDRHVLRFFAVMDDMGTPQFERRPFTILFFLADDKVEIRESYPLNCGRDNFPIFFRKAKMPRGAVSVDGPQTQPKTKSEYVDGHEWSIGETVTLMGTPFYIYDADDYTRNYFMEQMGVELAPSQDVQLPNRAVPRAQTPPYTGYGSWDDSMASVTHLIPKAPKKDFKKLYNKDGQILRFTARLASPKPEDVDRLFVINYYLFDDTLSIHEPPQRNLGIITGKFLEKAVHLNQTTGELFKPHDLLPGNVVKVYNRDFEILDMDEYTANTLSDPDFRHVKFDLHAVLEKIRESMRQQFPLVRDIFRRFDADHDGVLTFAEMKRALEKFGFQLSDEETMAVMRHFDKRGDGQVSYNEFCDTLLDEDYTSDMMKTKPAMDASHDPHYAGRAVYKTDERVETYNVKEALRHLGETIYARVGFQHRLFREFSHLTHTKFVSVEQIVYALEQLGHSFHVEDITRCVLYILPNADLKAIPYVQFFKTLDTAYHDLTKGR